MQNRFLTWWHARWKITRFMAYVALLIWTHILIDLIFGVSDSPLVNVLVGATLGAGCGLLVYHMESWYPIKSRVSNDDD